MPPIKAEVKALQAAVVELAGRGPATCSDCPSSTPNVNVSPRMAKWLRRRATIRPLLRAALCGRLCERTTENRPRYLRPLMYVTAIAAQTPTWARRLMSSAIGSISMRIMPTPLGITVDSTRE
jgi:hypothetical protein